MVFGMIPASAAEVALVMWGLIGGIGAMGVLVMLHVEWRHLCMKRHVAEAVKQN